MASKNDLSALKLHPKNTLGNLQGGVPTNILSKHISEAPQAKAWRKPKPASEKQTEMVGLRFTKPELEMIKKKAWLVPIATYLKSVLEIKEINR